MTKAEEVRAEVIDSDITQLSGLDKWLVETSERMAERAKEYMVYEVTDEESHGAAFNDLRAIGRDIKEIENERKSMTRVLDEAKKRAVNAERSAVKVLADIRDQLKASDDAYKKNCIAEKVGRLREVYEDAAPDLALPFDDNPPLVPFDRIVEVFGNGALGDKWRNFGTLEKSAEEQMLKAVTLIADAEKTIDETVNEDDRQQVKACYFATLDLQAALAEARRIKEQREALAALEAERKAREEEERRLEAERELEEFVEQHAEKIPPVAEPPKLTPMQTLVAQVSENEAQPEYGEDVPELVFFAYIPNEKRDLFIAYCKANDIHGSMRPTHGMRYTLVPKEG